MSDLEQRFDKIEQQLQTIANNQPPSMYGNQFPVRSDEIDLRELWNVLWGGKWWIIGITFLFAVAGVFYALSLPNMYKSEVLLAPADENSGGGLSSLSGSFGGLAGLAGVNLGNTGGDKTALAIEILRSRAFISKFITEHNLLVPLMATNGWDVGSGELIIDPKIYDFDNSKWVRKEKMIRGSKPTTQEAYEKFIKIFSVDQNKKTNFVSLSIKHYSPEIARSWVDLIVEDINEEVKKRDVLEAKKSIQYLTNELKKTSISDMQAIFYELIEEQSKVIMFAAVRIEYVFKTIDPAYLPEVKDSPKRSVIVIVSLFLGACLGFFLLIFRNFLWEK